MVLARLFNAERTLYISIQKDGKEVAVGLDNFPCPVDSRLFRFCYL